MEGGGRSWGHGPRGTSPEAPGAAGCARPGAPLGVAVGDGHCLIWMQAGSSCRGIALVLLLFLCCSFSLASTTRTHAPGTATALWMLHLQPAPQPELLPSRDEHSAPANSHPARGRCVARGWWLKTVRAHHPPALLLATVSSRPGRSDSPALLWGLPCSRPLQAEPSWGPRPALPTSRPQASGSPFRVCAVWPWARFPFGWDAQNQTWCLFFCHVSCAIRLFLLVYFSVPASLCRLWINPERGKTLVTASLLAGASPVDAGPCCS